MKTDELREYMMKYIPLEIEMLSGKPGSLAEQRFDRCDNEYVNHWDDAWGDIMFQRHSRFSAHTYHSHEFFEIMFMFIGSGENFIEEKSEKLREGDVCVITPGVFHLPYVPGDSVLVNFCVREGFVQEFFRHFHGGDAVDFFRADPAGERHKYMIIRGCPEIYEAGARLISAFTENEWQDAQAERNAYLSVFLSTLAKFSGGRTILSTETFRPDDLAPTIISRIQNEYMTISLDALAGEYGYSKSHICRLIRRASGTTFTEMVNRLRVREACRLIDSGMRCSEAAEKCGFSDAAYFARTFRKYMGMAPGEFRHRGDHSDAEKHARTIYNNEGNSHEGWEKDGR